MSLREAILETALQDIVDTLGPEQACPCPENCEGCREEAQDALTIARKALEGSYPSQDTGDAPQAVSVAPGALSGPVKHMAPDGINTVTEGPNGEQAVTLLGRLRRGNGMGPIPWRRKHS